MRRVPWSPFPAIIWLVAILRITANDVQLPVPVECVAHDSLLIPEEENIFMVPWQCFKGTEIGHLLSTQTDNNNDDDEGQRLE